MLEECNVRAVRTCDLQILRRMLMNDSRLYMVNDIFNRMSKEFVTVDGNVRKIQRETLTPYKVATVILIKEYCNDTTKGTFYPFIMQYDTLSADICYINSFVFLYTSLIFHVS